MDSHTRLHPPFTRSRHLDGLDMGRDGLRDLRNDRVGARSGDGHQHIGQQGRHEQDARNERDQRDRELVDDRLRRPGLLELLAGLTASRIPPSQSSDPFFVFNNLTGAKPASFSHLVVSATE